MRKLDSWIRGMLFAATGVSVLVTGLIIFSVFSEALRFFAKVPLTEFLFGLEWSPQTAIRADQSASDGTFGAVPVFLGTIHIMLIAVSVSVPLGVMAAIYLAFYASRRARATLKPILEVLAGVPTVVYGYFAVVAISPFVRALGNQLGISVSSESALVAGTVMGIMMMPFIMSLSEDVLSAVPKALKMSSLAMGATMSETVVRVMLPAALPGIAGAVLLGISRAIGETMIVLMAAGLAANLTVNPLESVTTVTVQIVTLLIGDHEFDSVKTLSAFALGFTLVLMTLTLNVAALLIVRRYREQYE